MKLVGNLNLFADTWSATLLTGIGTTIVNVARVSGILTMMQEILRDLWATWLQILNTHRKYIKIFLEAQLAM